MLEVSRRTEAKSVMNANEFLDRMKKKSEFEVSAKREKGHPSGWVNQQSAVKYALAFFGKKIKEFQKTLKKSTQSQP